MLRFRCFCALLALALAAFLLPGCSGGPRVDGTVTFNNEPVSDGTITFVPSTPGADKGGRASAPIQGGKYSLRNKKGFTPGSYRVEIIWNKATGRKVDTPGDPGNLIDETVQVI